MRSIPMNLLEIENLSVGYATEAGEVAAVRDFSLTVRAGECVGIVGESGAGKSQALLAVMGLLPAKARMSGCARFETTELLGLRAVDLDRIRGAGIGMVFQDPLTSLTPHMTIGDQLAEPLVKHRALSWKAARARALALLNRVRMNDATQRLRQYPHELSGGMRQRAMIAMALACEPRLLIADEPTTALDVTIQEQILSLLAELKRERGMSLVLVTHDLGVVAGLADRVLVMQAGRIVEQGAVGVILKAPMHAHTRELLQAMPRMDDAISPVSAPTNGDALVELAQLRMHFVTRKGWLAPRSVLRAVDGVDLVVQAGEAVGIVGESGSGKSTLARAALRLLQPTSGHIVWLGRAVGNLSAAHLKPLRRDLQIVFQDPLASLDPRMRVGEIVSEPLRVHRPDLNHAARLEAATEMLGQVALPAEMLQRYPHQLSGGQCQRVGIARAMILKPKLLVCDEAVSALDVTTQAQIVALVDSLRREYGLTLLFISHNLAIVRRLCNRVLVLYLGRMMELACAEQLYEQPRHPYTRALLDSIPVADPDIQPARLLRTLEGELPSPLAPPSGCVFHTRCPHAIEVCRQRIPAWERVEASHYVACHRWRELTR